MEKDWTNLKSNLTNMNSSNEYMRVSTSPLAKRLSPRNKGAMPTAVSNIKNQILAKTAKSTFAQAIALYAEKKDTSNTTATVAPTAHAQAATSAEKKKLDAIIESPRESQPYSPKDISKIKALSKPSGSRVTTPLSKFRDSELQKQSSTTSSNTGTFGKPKGSVANCKTLKIDLNSVGQKFFD